MEIIVISPEEEIPNEVDWVIKLFEAGLCKYHLRKPGIDDDGIAKFVAGIPEQWRDRIVPHQAYKLVKSLGLGGWHFKDDEQQLSLADQWRDSRSGHQTLSRSIHRLDDLSENLSGWDYVFVSPVFQSISKRDYEPSWEEAQLSASLACCREVYGTSLYALGGVDDSRIAHCGQLGFDGVAMLGAIWESRYPVEFLRRAQEAVGLVK